MKEGGRRVRLRRKCDDGSRIKVMRCEQDSTSHCCFEDGGGHEPKNEKLERWQRD